MKQFKARVISNKKIAPDHYVLSFKAPRIAKKTKPGQFFNIKVSDSHVPFLRRPLGAHKIGNDKIEILYKVVGAATQILSGKAKGDVIDVLGPLGNGFNIKLHVTRDTLHVANDRQRVILVAGGHGIAPLYALARKLKKSGYSSEVFIGARTKGHVVCDREFRKLNTSARVSVATEDGSKGYKGLITDLLQKKIKDDLSSNNPTIPQSHNPTVLQFNYTTIYACGPNPMLKTVAKLAKRFRIPCQVSLEEYVACGTGTCLGCAVKTKSGYKLVCKDGPVFEARDIVWN